MISTETHHSRAVHRREVIGGDSVIAIPKPTGAYLGRRYPHPPVTIPTNPRTLVRALSKSGTTAMVVGTFVAAVGAYAFQLVAGRALGPEAFAPITVLWTIQFLVFTTVFIPMEQLTIRRLSAAVPEAEPRRLFVSAIVVSVVVSVGFGALTLDRLLDGEVIYLAVIMVVIAAYGAFALARGALAGRRRFVDYGWSTLAESVVRLVVLLLLLAVGAGVVGVAWSLVAGALIIYLWKPFRSKTPPAAPTAATGMGAAFATFIVANAASQTIVAAGPLVVGALGASAAERSVFFETFLLFRAPLTVAYSLIARVLPPFTRTAESEDRSLLTKWSVRAAVAAGILGVAAFAVGHWIGPNLVAFFLGEEYRPSANLAAFAAAGVVIATAALFVQQMLIALRATGGLAIAWLCGLVAAGLTVGLTAGDASLRVGLGFLVGETVSLGLIVFTVLAAAKKR